MTICRDARIQVAVLAVVGWLNVAFAEPSLKEQEREALRQQLLGIIQNSPLKNARLGVQMVSLDDGSVVFSQNPDELLNPASNVKLVTAAAVLARLGLDYRFETEFLTDESFKSGKMQNLFVRGKGDPSLSTDRLWGIVSELSHTGLTEISQDIVLDDTFFDADRVPPGFDQEVSDRAYMAPPGALSLNSNVVGVYLRPNVSDGQPAIVEMEPASEYFVVDNRLKTGGKLDRRFDVLSRAEKGGRQRILVTGVVPVDRGTWSVWKKIDEPALYFGHTLKQMLMTRGIAVKGKVRLGTTPASARMVHVAWSESLDIVLKRLNKNSSNFFAENLLKTLGAEVKGPPGTSAKGVEAVEEFLEQDVGIFPGSYVMRNGSGLNDTNRFSAAQLVRILNHMQDRFSVSSEYLSALTVAGKDGTLKYRFEGSEAIGRLRGKTGTLENVSALSGYVQAVGGERFMFAVMVNDFPGRAGTVVRHIDSMGAQLAALGTPMGPARPPVDLASRPSLIRSGGDWQTRFQTYVKLTAKRDKRNVPFLHSAWSTENDSFLRVFLADAAFQADPKEGMCARMVLDSLSPSEELLKRLQNDATSKNQPMLGFEALIELASTGDSEAMTRILEWVKVSVKNEALAKVMAQALAEISRHAGDVVMLSLRPQSAQDSEYVLSLLVQGLVEREPETHPLWLALRRMQASPQVGVAEFAKKMEANLLAKVETHRPQFAEKMKAMIAPGVTLEPLLTPPTTQAQANPEARPGG